MDPSFIPAQNDLGLSFLQKRMYADAEKQFVRVNDLSKSFGTASFAILYALSGKKDESLRLLNERLKTSNSEYVSPYFVAQIYSALNDHDQAFQWLEKSFESRESLMVNLDVDPLLDNLHLDPRFSDLKQRMGFWK